MLMSCMCAQVAATPAGSLVRIAIKLQCKFWPNILNYRSAKSAATDPARIAAAGEIVVTALELLEFSSMHSPDDTVAFAVQVSANVPRPAPMTT